MEARISVRRLDQTISQNQAIHFAPGKCAERVRTRGHNRLASQGGSIRIEIEGVKRRHLGYLSDEQTKVHAFNAADILVS